MLGLGAGHMRSEYDEAGIPFDGGTVRVDRLEESVAIVRGLLDGDEVTFTRASTTRSPGTRRGPPRHGCRCWSAATDAGCWRLPPAPPTRSASSGSSHNRDATEVRLTHFTAEGLDEQVAWVRENAGDRLDHLELTALVQIAQVTDDRRAAATAIAERMGQRSPSSRSSSRPTCSSAASPRSSSRSAPPESGGAITTWISFAERPRSDQTLDTLGPVIEALR